MTLGKSSRSGLEFGGGLHRDGDDDFSDSTVSALFGPPLASLNGDSLTSGTICPAATFPASWDLTFGFEHGYASGEGHRARQGYSQYQA